MLLCVLDHPTQYDPPLWRAMASAGRRRPLVWYVQAAPPADPEIARDVDWSSAAGGVDQRHVPLTRLTRALLALKPRPAAVLVSGWKRPATLQVLPVARALGIPVILATDKTLNEASPGGLLGLGYTGAHSAKARLFDGFLTTGLLGAQYLASLGVPHDRIAKGLYPIDLRFWHQRKQQLAERSRALRAEIGAGPDAFVLLAVCKLSQRENPTDLLEAFARLSDRNPNAYFVQVGDGPLRARFEQRVRELGLTRRVHVAGYVAYEDLAAYYGAADAFAHVPACEPWGISVLEAMACELPVLASTTVGCAADLVVHGRTGALAYPGDVSSIAEALQILATQLRGPDAKQRCLEAVRVLDVHPVGGGLADLTERLQRAGARPAPIGSVLYSDIKNEFGRWSA
jgi:glycosyltransferase involved in cell wall biosynthesis